MDTTHLIEASATIITITTLKRGDVYKRLERPDAYAATATPLRFGVVTDVMHNGEDAAITALEFTPTYSEVVVALKVFRAGVPEALFAAQPEEVREHVAQVAATAQRKVNELRNQLEKAVETQTQSIEVMNQALSGGLTAPEVRVGRVIAEEA